MVKERMISSTEGELAIPQTAQHIPLESFTASSNIAKFSTPVSASGWIFFSFIFILWKVLARLLSCFQKETIIETNKWKKKYKRLLHDFSSTLFSQAVSGCTPAPSSYSREMEIGEHITSISTDGQEQLSALSLHLAFHLLVINKSIRRTQMHPTWYWKSLLEAYNSSQIS